jgi:hypothetical protein
MYAGNGASKMMASLVLVGSCHPLVDSSRHIKVEGTLARAALELWFFGGAWQWPALML